jgi:histidinol phosphatase-like enzyme
VIIKDKGFISEPDDVVLVDRAPEAIKKMSSMGAKERCYYEPVGNWQRAVL